MKKNIENKGKTATDALKNEVADKASMSEVRRRVVTMIMIFSNVRLLPVKQFLSILMVTTFSIFIGGCGEEKMSVAALQKSAEKGNVKAQYILGVRYLTGEGIPEDRNKASEWIHKAAEGGYIDAQYNLGVWYYEDKQSYRFVSQSNARAFEWIQKAAKQGDIDAQCLLGEMYHYGEGVPKSCRKW